MDKPAGLSQSERQRNFVLGAASGMMRVLADTVADPKLIVTWFVTYLTGSPLVFGLLLPLQKVGVHLPQLLVSGAAQQLKRKMPLYRALGLVRLLSWTVATLLVFAVGRYDRRLILMAFLALYGAYWVTEGVAGIAGMDIVTKAVSADRRGRFFAWINSGGAVLALATSFLLSYVFDERRGLPFPNNFGLLFGLAVLGVGLSVFLFTRVREPVEQVVTNGRVGLVPLRQIAQILRRDPNFARFVLAYAIQHLSGIAATFFVVYVKQVLGAPESLLAAFLAAATATSVVSALFWGWLSDRYGSRICLVLCSVLHIPVALIPILLGRGAPYLIFVPLGILATFAAMSLEIAPKKFMMDIAPASERMVYFGLLNTVLGGVSLLYALGGLIVARWGYYAVFWFAVLCPTIATVLFWGLREPVAAPVAVATVDGIRALSARGSE